MPAQPPESARVRAIRSLNRRGVRLLHFADFVVVYAGLLLVTCLLILLRPSFNAWAHMPRYVWSYAVVALLHLAVFSFGGLYDDEARLGERTGLTRLVTSVWIASLTAGLASWLLGEYLIPRSVLVAYAVIGPVLLAINRRVSRSLRLRASGPPRLLLVGTAGEAAVAERHLIGARVELLGHVEGIDTLEREVVAREATDVLLLDGSALDDLYAEPLARLEAAGVGTLQVVKPQDSLLGLRSVGEMGGIPFVPLSTHVLRPSQARLKRWMDLVVLLITLPLTVLLGIVTTVYVAIRAGRPLLFVQDRVGRDTVTFRMLKFRTMSVNAEADTGPVQAARNDPRVVPGMDWLRRSRLDELPQLVNVLKGEMTVVGPRPERPEEMARYEQEFPGYRRRHQTPPGITGLAQVYGRYDTHIEYKLGHDLHYLANWSPVLDLQIMLRTAWVIVAGRL